MTYVPYSYKHPSARRYVFISVGKKRIEKVVDFVPLKAKNIMNLGFGDLMADGSINYKANSTYYDLFGKDFIVYGIKGTDDDNEIIQFDPHSNFEYLAF